MDSPRPELAIINSSSFLDSVHAAISISSSSPDIDIVCESPLCAVRFPQSGLKIEPRRFCSDACRQHASIIRRAARLLAGLSDESMLEILREANP
jgi:hypothetical protein